jgi:hypothetical protein
MWPTLYCTIGTTSPELPHRRSQSSKRERWPGRKLLHWLLRICDNSLQSPVFYVFAKEGTLTISESSLQYNGRVQSTIFSGVLKIACIVERMRVKSKTLVVYEYYGNK